MATPTTPSDQPPQAALPSVSGSDSHLPVLGVSPTVPPSEAQLLAQLATKKGSCPLKRLASDYLLSPNKKKIRIQILAIEALRFYYNCSLQHLDLVSCSPQHQ
jgi:hypothetical protein